MRCIDVQGDVSRRGVHGAYGDDEPDDAAEYRHRDVVEPLARLVRMSVHPVSDKYS